MRHAETSLFTVLGAGDNGVLTLLRVITDPLLAIISRVVNSKNVGDTLGMIPNLSIPREVADLIDGQSDSVAAEV